MIDTHFTDRDLAFLASGIVFALMAVVLFSRGNVRASLLLLLVSGLAFRLMMAFIDPFVNIWDEQYHALVAKNLTSDFFHPVLVANSADSNMSPAYWAFTDTWLHKPPLFLWQMALAIKMFGATTWAIRIPSVVLSVLMIPAIYRCGKIIGNERVGFIAALLITCSNIQINIVSGWLNTDHNDAVFAYYVFFSLWTWMEYVHTKKTRWLVLMSCFAAGAVLTKWLPGMLVFGVAFTVQFLFFDNRLSKNGWLKLFLAVGITTLLAAPWFVYASQTWPEQWSATMGNYAEHLSSDFAHSGSWWYHFDQVREQFGWVFIVAFVISLFIYLHGKSNGQIKAGILVALVAVYGFYCFVPTKMPFFCFPVTPLLLLIVAFGIERVIEQAQRKMLWLSVVGVVIIFFTTNIGRLEHYHTDRDPKEFYRKTRINNRECFERAGLTLPANTVIFNCGEWNAVPCMYYTGFTAYDGLPSADQLENCRIQNRPVAIFRDNPAEIPVVPGIDVIVLDEPLIRNGF